VANDVPLDWFTNNVLLDSLNGDVPLELYNEHILNMSLETKFEISGEGYIVLNFCKDA
jgi:hypothetical protein